MIFHQPDIFKCKCDWEFHENNNPHFNLITTAGSLAPASGFVNIYYVTEFSRNTVEMSFCRCCWRRSIKLNAAGDLTNWYWRGLIDLFLSSDVRQHMSVISSRRYTENIVNVGRAISISLLSLSHNNFWVNFTENEIAKSSINNDIYFLPLPLAVDLLPAPSFRLREFKRKSLSRRFYLATVKS